MTEDVTYDSYLALDRLLGAQNPQSGRHDEMLFIIVHQTTELWLKQILHELRAAQTLIGAGDVEPALKALARVSRIQFLITQSWDPLSTLTPPDYLTFRGELGTGSGFQSLQFRLLEFVLGLKNAAHLGSFEEGSPARARLAQALVAPSLYDTAIARLDAAGVAVPAHVLARDVAQPYKPDEGVEAAWLTVYRDPEAHWELYALAEKLVDLEDSFRQWRFRHLTTVERVIGRKRGTGGTSGVDYLATGLDRWCFPELWSLRTKL
ncbi:MAG: tryptophan 2,3-dioxygenase family protein [Maricaulaceae bacterium]|jgi:tryptophan 2,3-dioxygenase